MKKNPFYPVGAVPPEYFIGRKSQIQIIFDIIPSHFRGHLAFYGISGIGKSSLLNVLMSPQIWQEYNRDYSKAFIVYIDCSTIDPFTPLNFWRNILVLLKDEVDNCKDLMIFINQTLNENLIDSNKIRQTLRKIQQYDHNKFLLLLIDDYDCALKENNQYGQEDITKFLREFRNLCIGMKTKKYISTIVTTSRPLNELGPKPKPFGSPWYNHYLFQLIKPYSKREVLEIFFNSKSKYYIPIKSSLQETVLNITGGHPQLIQQAGYFLHNKIQDCKIYDFTSFVSDFRLQTEHIFYNIWQFSTSEEQIILMLISMSNLKGDLGDRKFSLTNVNKIFSQRKREIEDLEARGIIKQIGDEEQNSYEFRSLIMKWWVLEEIRNCNDQEIKKREKIFLSLMSREQLNTVIQVIKYLEKYPNVVESFVKTIRNLFTGR